MNYNNKLARAIDATGLAKAEVAKRAGVSPSYLSNMLAGAVPSLPVRVRVARVVRVPVVELWPDAKYNDLLHLVRVP